MESTDPDELSLFESARPPHTLLRTDVLIIGGGVIGCATAYYLAQRGIDVAVVERGELSREASGANAGTLHIQIPAFHFREQYLRASPCFPALKLALAKRAATLSGGQRQMLGVARALISDPRLLILDEPSAGLAPAVVDEVFAKIKAINAEGVSILMVEQKARQCLALSDLGYVLDMGQNRMHGTGEALLHDPEVIDSYLGNRGRLDISALKKR